MSQPGTAGGLGGNQKRLFSKLQRLFGLSITNALKNPGK
jgi:hypothetical protein